MRLESCCPILILLLHARKIYKLRLKRVRLCFLEEMLLGEWRTDDLPGSEVPQRYFDYLKTGDTSLLDDVFRHNAIDVFTLSKLLKIFAVAYRSPEELTHGKDIFSVGRTYERKEDIASAERCYVLSKREYRVPSVLQLAFLCKRAKRTEDAINYFLELAEESPQANVELAKYYEHHEKSYEAALDCTDRAIALVDSQNELAVLFKRRKRLLAKLSDGRKGGSV
jgi:tetratricopeptide (TPR) repeat protein